MTRARYLVCCSTLTITIAHYGIQQTNVLIQINLSVPCQSGGLAKNFKNLCFVIVALVFVFDMGLRFQMYWPLQTEFDTSTSVSWF